MENAENINLEQKLDQLIEQWSPVLTSTDDINDLKPLLIRLVQLVSEVSQISENLDILLFLREQEQLDHETYDLLYNRLKLKGDLLVY